MGEILIIGGGIGGLTAAAALAREGFGVRVLEQAPEYRPVGAGITVQINGMRALKRVGLDEPVIAAGNVLNRLKLRFSDGRVVFVMDTEAFAQEFGAPFVGIHRAALQQALSAAVDSRNLTMGVEVREIAEEVERISVPLPKGPAAEGDVLIGADGIHSFVRGYLWGDEPLRNSGYTSWRGVCTNPQITPLDEAGEFWGERNVFGYVPLDGEQLYWFATRQDNPDEKDEGNPRPRLLELFGDWNGPMRQFIEATPPESILRTDIQDRPPRFPWGRGQLTLLGDAAHPMLPNLGQGGCQAIEDAVVLANCLKTSSSLESGLREYEKQRWRRTKYIVTNSHRICALAHGRGRLMRFARSWLFPYLPMAIRKLQMRSVFRFAI